MEPIRDPERARRLARVLVSDIAAAAGDQVRIGLEKDDLFDRLRFDIQAARVFYRHAVDRTMPAPERAFDHALVDVLVAAHRKVQTPIW
jgi:hypothetical protein